MKRFLLSPRAFLLILTLALAGCGNQPEAPTIPGVQGPFFNVMDGKVLISLTLEQVEILGGARIPLGELEQSYVELTPAQFGGTMFQVGLSVEDIDGHDWSMADPHALPGGRPLPGVIGGELPTLAVHVPELAGTTFYVSDKVFGFFIPMHVDTPAIITSRLVMEGKVVGNISVVGHDATGENSGLLLLMNLDVANKERFRRLIELSKQEQNRHKLF